MSQWNQGGGGNYYQGGNPYTTSGGNPYVSGGGYGGGGMSSTPYTSQGGYQQQPPQPANPAYSSSGGFAQPPGSQEVGTVVKKGEVYMCVVNPSTNSKSWVKTQVTLTSDCKLNLYPIPGAGIQVRDRTVDLITCTMIKLLESCDIRSADGQMHSLKASTAAQTKEWFDAVREVVQNELRNRSAGRAAAAPSGGAYGSGGGYPGGYQGGYAQQQPPPQQQQQQQQHQQYQHQAAPVQPAGGEKDPAEDSSDDGEIDENDLADLPDDMDQLRRMVAKLQNRVDELSEQNEALQAQIDSASVARRDDFARAQAETLSSATSQTTFDKTAGAASSRMATIDFDNDEVEFHERLGGGGSGASVFRCSIKGFCFAGKVLDTAYAQHDDIEPMMKEIFIMTNLKDDHIVAYLGSQFVPAKREVRLFTELYSGTLKDVIDQRTKEGGRSFVAKEIKSYAFQIAKGVAYLQSQNPPIIHRDLKSDNVFVQWDAQKNPKQLRIGDFDVSKVMDSGKVAFTRSVGTPGYIAPEVFGNLQKGAKGKAKQYKGHDTKADIWSYGMIVYEMMTLKRPYWDCSALEVSERNQSGVRPELTKDVDVNACAGLIKLYKDCTEKDPKKRPNIKKVLTTLATM